MGRSKAEPSWTVFQVALELLTPIQRGDIWIHPGLGGQYQADMGFDLSAEKHLKIAMEKALIMSNDLEEKAEQHEEDLRIVADSDLSASWIAETILEHYNLDMMETIQTEKESTECDNTRSVEAQNEPEESIFAY
jgi:hypothetical protein